MLAPTTSLSDALALAAASSGGAQARFEYGWVRGAGSAAFILGTIASGQMVNVLGPSASLTLQSLLLAAAAVAVRFVPAAEPPKSYRAGVMPAPVRDLARIAKFRWVVLVAALILGSHAMHDAFLMIVWNRIGISASIGAMLWAESVAAEVLVFFWLGPLLLRYIRSQTGMAVAAAAAIVRWVLTAQVSSIAAFAFIEPLHGLTFALLHLACMRVLAAVVPAALAATAQAVYGFGIGAMTAALTLESGWLYARFGSAGFWGMAVLAALAMPFIWRVRRA